MTDTPPTLTESALRGIACKCPRCGKGKLYAGFLDLRPRCEACGLDYAFIDAGDGPAIFIIMIAGAIVVGAALIVEVKYQPPFWLHAALWLPLILATTLLPLRSMKSLLIALAVPSQGGRRPPDRSRRRNESVVELRWPVSPSSRRWWSVLRRPRRLAVAAPRSPSTTLIAALNERLAAAPVPLPPVAHGLRCRRRGTNSAASRFTATYAPLPDAMVYSSGSAVRDDVSGPGTWAFLPAQLASGETVAINAGFVQNTMQDRAQQDRAAARLVTGEPVALTGYIRFPESAGRADAGGGRSQAALVRARSSRRWPRARWARAASRRAVLHRSGIAGARQRHPETRPASRPSQGRSPAIRHHLVHAGMCGRHRLRRLVAHAAPQLSFPRIHPEWLRNHCSPQSSWFQCVQDDRPFHVHSRRSQYCVSP